MIKRILVVLFLIGVIIPLTANAQAVRAMTPGELAQYVQTLERQLAMFKQQLASKLAEEARNTGNLTSPNLQCLNLGRSLAFGARGNDVVALQTFLSETGDFENREASGFYGFYTVSAVQSFQRREGIVTGGSPVANGYGVVGPLTRARIQELSCGTGDDSGGPAPACRPGDLFSSVTGQSCPVASAPLSPLASSYQLTTATAGVLGSGSGTITSSPSGINCGTDCTQSYNSGTQVTLAATPAAGSTFVGWSGNLTHLTSPATITMNGNKSVTAIFAAASTLPPAVTLRGFQLRVTDQATNAGLAGVTVTINRSGTYVATQTTDASGYTPAISLRVGELHTFSFSKTSYRAISPIILIIPSGTNVYIYGPIRLEAGTVVPPPPPATPSFTVTSPSNNQQWTVTNGPVIQWSSANIPSGNQITVELLTPSNGSVPGFSSFTTANDGSESGRLTNSSVASGSYYFRLNTVVNGQTIYGGSGVFQFAQPSAAASITVSSPTTNSQWSPTNSPVVSWTTAGGADSQNVLIELLTPSGGSVPGFTSRSVRNDQRPAFNLLTGSTVASGSYYFRLSTVVNGQTIYGGSGVFQFAQPLAAATPVVVTAPTGGENWLAGSSQTVRWTENIPDPYPQATVIIDLAPATDRNNRFGYNFSSSHDGQETIVIPSSVPAGNFVIVVLVFGQNSINFGYSNPIQITR